MGGTAWPQGMFHTSHHTLRGASRLSSLVLEDVADSGGGGGDSDDGNNDLDIRGKDSISPPSTFPLKESELPGKGEDDENESRSRNDTDGSGDRNSWSPLNAVHNICSRLYGWGASKYVMWNNQMPTDDDKKTREKRPGYANFKVDGVWYSYSKEGVFWLSEV